MPDLRCTVQTCTHNQNYYCNLDSIVVGGNSAKKADDGVHKIGNLLLDGSSHFLSAYPCCNGSYSGTGDLFASCITGGLARDISLTEMMQTAGSFLEKSLIDSVEEHVPVNEGVNFEKYLYLLHT